LSFKDWQEQPRSITFRYVIAYRWQELDDAVPRDDTTFEALESPWLECQAKLQAVPAHEYAHDVLVLQCLRRSRRPRTSHFCWQTNSGLQRTVERPPLKP
jgi:hypothetical protein